MNRRGFLSALISAGVAAAADPEKLLWTPGRKLISIPKPPVYVPPVGSMDVIRSLRSGNWSDPSIWSGGIVPREGSRVSIDHTITTGADSRVKGLDLLIGKDGQFDARNGGQFTHCIFERTGDRPLWANVPADKPILFIGNVITVWNKSRKPIIRFPNWAAG